MRGYRTWVEQAEKLAHAKAEFWECGMIAFDVPDASAAFNWCKTHDLDIALHASLPNALTLPSVAQVRNPRLISVLKAACLELGARLHEHCSANVHIVSSGRPAVSTSEGEFHFDQLVITTGAWSSLALPGFPTIPNIRPVRGQMLLFKLAPGVLNTILYREGIYIIPRLDGHILVGSTLEDAGFDKSTDAKTAHRLHHQAAKLLPILAAHKPINHWAGLRPGSPDNIPLIGRHPDFDYIYLNVGHYRYGVTMAPASAELLADLMEDKTPALDPTPYSWAAALQRRWTDRL